MPPESIEVMTANPTEAPVLLATFAFFSALFRALARVSPLLL